MRAVRITADHLIDVVEVEAPAPASTGIVVRPMACGICGTDLHICRHGFPGTHYPVIPGHEFAGYVSAVGRDVKGIKEGDYVAVNPNVTCGHCEWCKESKPHLCTALQPIGVGRAGAAAELVSVPAENAYTLSDRIGHGVAALIEPLACAMHAIESAPDVKGRRLAVVGAGTMGLLIVIAARHAGAAEITVVDTNAAKHATALAVGADRAATPEAVTEERYDIVFEAAGAMRALQLALTLVRKTGTLVQVGVHHTDATIAVHPFKVYEHELRIVGSNSLANRFSAAVEIMPDLVDKVSLLLGTPFSVWAFAAAVESMTSGAVVKTQLHFD